MLRGPHLLLSFFTLIALPLTLLAAPANVKPVAAVAKPIKISAVRAPADLTRLAFGFSTIPDTQFAFRQGQGGSLAVGLLFGVIGMALNANAMAQTTEAEAKLIKGFFGSIDVAEMLKERMKDDTDTMGKVGLSYDQSVESRSTLSVIPYVLVQADYQGKLISSLIFDLELKDNTSRAIWSGRYQYHLPGNLSKEEVLFGQDVAQTQYVTRVKDALKDLASIVYRDLGGDLPRESKGKVIVISLYLVSNFDPSKVGVGVHGILLEENGNRKIFNLLGEGNSNFYGIHSFSEDQIYRIVKP